MIATKMAMEAEKKEGDKGDKMMQNRGPRMEIHLSEGENGNGRL